jgi:hypothetical protein
VLVVAVEENGRLSHEPELSQADRDLRDDPLEIFATIRREHADIQLRPCSDRSAHSGGAAVPAEDGRSATRRRSGDRTNDAA